MSAPEAGTAIGPDWLLERITGRRATDIGAGIESLIRADALTPGDQLPTIRDLARAASVSVGTVLTAWNHLRDLGLIETHRRGGTSIKAIPARAEARPINWAALDLQQGAPDLALQPDLRNALLDSLTDGNLNAVERENMTGRLRQAVAQGWPFLAEDWTTAGGGAEALLLATAAAAPPGSTIAVDEPVRPGFFETMHDLQLTPIAVTADEHGPTPDSLESALKQGATTFVFQPGAPFADCYTVTDHRVHQLSEVLAREEFISVNVVEDDPIGPLASHAIATLGVLLPGRVIHVRSYCKAYGTDVRTSVMGGAKSLVHRANALRSNGVASNSRILQNTLAHLIDDAAANGSVTDARRRYGLRRDLFVAALRRKGLTVHAAPSSIVLWVEVANEADALIDLASYGILAGAGSKSFISRPAIDLIRLSPLQLDENDLASFDRLASIVASAAHGARSEFFD